MHSVLSLSHKADGVSFQGRHNVATTRKQSVDFVGEFPRSQRRRFTPCFGLGITNAFGCTKIAPLSFGPEVPLLPIQFQNTLGAAQSRRRPRSEQIRTCALLFLVLSTHVAPFHDTYQAFCQHSHDPRGLAPSAAEEHTLPPSIIGERMDDVRRWTASDLSAKEIIQLLETEHDGLQLCKAGKRKVSRPPSSTTDR